MIKTVLLDGKALLQDVNSRGFTVVEGLTSAPNEIGRILTEIAPLTPVCCRHGEFAVVDSRTEQSNPGPVDGCSKWHTDGLYLTRPPQYVALIAVEVDQQSRPTELADTRDTVMNLMRGQFRNFGELFIKLGEDRDRPQPIHPFIKYDPSVPSTAFNWAPSCEFLGNAGQDGPSLIEEIGRTFPLLIDAMPRYEHQWKPMSLLFFDNQRMLHRRKPGPASSARKLYRFWFDRMKPCQ